jgi:hypothetical protein
VSISLSSKLASIQPNQTVSEVNTMLQQHVHVRISWWAKRMVSLEGYTGEVEINTLAERYLQASQFQHDQDFSLQDRVACYTLWDKVQDLYKKSYVELGKTWIYWFLTELREFRPWCRACAGDPQAIMGQWEFGSRKNSLLEFTPEKFQQMWPNVKPMGKSTYYSAGSVTGVEKWLATKEMVDSAIQKAGGSTN